MLHLPTPPAVNLMSSMTPRAWPPRAASLGTVSMLPVYWCLCWETKLFPVSSVSLSLCLLSPPSWYLFPFLTLCCSWTHEPGSQRCSLLHFQLQSLITNGLKSLLKIKKKNLWSSFRGLSHGRLKFDMLNVNFIPPNHSLTHWYPLRTVFHKPFNTTPHHQAAPY